MEAYQKLGVTEVTTIANDSRGAYAWAKFGFKATDPPALAAKLTDRVTKAGKGQWSPVLPNATKAQKASIQAVIDRHKDDPRLPWHIAGIVTPKGQAREATVMGDGFGREARPHGRGIDGPAASLRDEGDVMPSKSDIMGVEPDGTRTDVWVLDELLADDDLDEALYPACDSLSAAR